MAASSSAAASSSSLLPRLADAPPSSLAARRHRTRTPRSPLPDAALGRQTPRAPPPQTLASERSYGGRAGWGAAAIPGPAGEGGGVSPVSPSSGGGLWIWTERTSSAAQISMAGAPPRPSAMQVHSLPPPSCGGFHGRCGGDGVHGRRRRRPWPVRVAAVLPPGAGGRSGDGWPS
ncbi:hypothetical protein PVAP13_4NG239011 [Panicum virgatum]|uniref:Uncharacterized protein n=1 Tax=Panicum virgatum TaxID=38727 RepID=A0A8T0T6I4_PANVG|nr:hypothetical protein PVAP13_4NG239011 [Panicum virgatum]